MGGGACGVFLSRPAPSQSPPRRPLRALTWPAPASCVECSIASGSVKVGDPLVAMDLTGLKTEEGKVTRLFARRGMAAIPLERATAGDIVQLAGLSTPVPTSTVAAPSITRPLFATPLDPPTLSMCFGVNDSPLGGKDGTQLTGTMISERLQKEAASNIALQVMAAVAQEVKRQTGGAACWSLLVLSVMAR